MSRRGKWTLLGIAVLAFLLSGWLVVGMSDREAIAAAETVVDLSDKEAAWLELHRDLRLGLWLDSPPLMFREVMAPYKDWCPPMLILSSRNLA